MYEQAFENGEVVALSESLEDMLIAEQESNETDEFWDEVFQGLRERYEPVVEVEGVEMEDAPNIDHLFR